MIFLIFFGLCTTCKRLYISSGLVRGQILVYKGGRIQRHEKGVELTNLCALLLNIIY